MADRKKKDEKLSAEQIARMKQLAGYGNPPTETRFKPGQSGNPRGRPRGAPPDLSLQDQPILAAALRVSRKKVRVREGDQTKEVAAYEALMDAFLAFGIQGNARYGGLIKDAIQTAEQVHAREIKRQIEVWSLYKEVFSAQIDRARRDNEPEPELYPHPDDIVIDYVKGPQFLGPWSAEQHQQALHTVAMCEVLLKQDELDHRSLTRPDGSPANEPGAARYFFNALQKTLPPRFRLTEQQILQMGMRFSCISKRNLLKQVYAEWRQIGQPKPRGYLSPEMSAVIPTFAAYHDLTIKILSGEIDVSGMSADQAADFMHDHCAEREPQLRARLHDVLTAQKARHAERRTRRNIGR